MEIAKEKKTGERSRKERNTPTCFPVKTGKMVIWRREVMVSPPGQSVKLIV